MCPKRFVKFYAGYFSLDDVPYVGGGGGGLVAKSCLTLGDPMDSSPPGFSAHEIS